MTTEKTKKQSGYREYIDVTQRGFAYGLISLSTDERVVERYIHITQTVSVDQAYRAAQRGAFLLLATVNRGHKRLIRDWGNVSGKLY